MSVLLRFLRRFARVADAVVDAVGGTSAWLVLFVIATLFGQWPLRELVTSTLPSVPAPLRGGLARNRRA